MIFQVFGPNLPRYVLIVLGFFFPGTLTDILSYAYLWPLRSIQNMLPIVTYI